ncbi:GH24751, partial [Drosophila grimshawi]
FSKTQEALASEFDSPSSSPRSYRTTSPCSSRSMSPVCSKLFDNDEDEDYSPACSDDDDDEDDGKTQVNSNSDTRESRIAANRAQPTNVMDILNLMDEGSEPIDDTLSDKEDLEELSSDVPPKLAQLRNQQSGDTIDVIENLIYRITLMINKRPELGKPETLDTLIRAINLFGANNNFANALTNILLESQFFAQIIKHGVVHQLYQLTKVEEMRKDGFAFLETLTNVGESNYGKEELVRLLRCDADLSAQQRAAISVAYIIKSHRLLYQFLYDGNALTLLFDLLLRKKSDNLYADEAADAVTAMSRFTLGIILPEPEPVDANAIMCATQWNATAAPLHENCDMRFLVQGEEDAALLCDTSEVFNKMLNSDFREGHDGEIQLRNYTASGLRYFLHLISCQSRHLAMPEYGALLEAFEMSRVYIIPELEVLLHERLIQFLDSHNCLRLLEWALKNYHAELTETAISYYLCAAMPAQDKLHLFRAAEDSTYASEWFQLLNDAVYERCRSTGY